MSQRLVLRTLQQSTTQHVPNDKELCAVLILFQFCINSGIPRHAFLPIISLPCERLIAQSKCCISSPTGGFDKAEVNDLAQYLC